MFLNYSFVVCRVRFALSRKRQQEATRIQHAAQFIIYKRRLRLAWHLHAWLFCPATLVQAWVPFVFVLLTALIYDNVSATLYCIARVWRSVSW